MNPVRSTTVVDFMEWVRQNRRDVASLCQLEKSQFMGLVIEYENSKGVASIRDPRSDLYRKWESTQWAFESSSSDSQALQRLR